MPFDVKGFVEADIGLVFQYTSFQWNPDTLQGYPIVKVVWLIPGQERVRGWPVELAQRVYYCTICTSST